MAARPCNTCASEPSTWPARVRVPALNSVRPMIAVAAATTLALMASIFFSCHHEHPCRRERTPTRCNTCRTADLCRQQPAQQVKRLPDLRVCLCVIDQDLCQLGDTAAAKCNAYFKLLTLGFLDVRMAINQELADLVLRLLHLHRGDLGRKH